MQKKPANRRRRVTRHLPLRIAAFSFAAIFVGSVPSVGTTADEFVSGSGKSEARIIRVGPSAAKLGLAPTVGVALADYLNTLGRGESIVVDWAALDGEIPKDVWDSIAPLRAESTAAAACRDRVRTYPEGSPAAFMEQRAKAAPAGPLGGSSFFIDSFAIPGALEISGAVARATASVTNGVREAKGTTDISELSLAGGAVVLTGLHWEAVQQTGAKKVVDGTFTVKGATIGGQAVPIPVGGADLRTVIGPINDALAPLGIALRVPRVDTVGGVARITTLGISVYESPLRQQLVGPLLGGIQPIREPLFDELLARAEEFDEAAGQEEEEGEPAAQLDADGCPVPQGGSGGGPTSARSYAATGVLLTDITLGVLSGVNTLDILLGGAVAFTEGQRFDSPFGEGIKLPKVAPQVVNIPGTPGSPGTEGTLGEVPSAGAGELAVAPPRAEAQRTGAGEGGRIGIIIGLIGLFVALAIAATDWFYILRNRALLPSGPAEA